MSPERRAADAQVPASRVLLSPTLDPLYHSYYVAGFGAALAGSGTTIGWLGRTRIPEVWRAVRHLFGTVALHDGHEVRFGVDCYDSGHFEQHLLDEVDRLFVANFDAGMVAKLPPERAAKVTPIGPSFGLRVFGWVECFAMALRGSWSHHLRPGACRRFVAGLYHQRQLRLPIEAYLQSRPRSETLFVASNFYRKHDQVNELRARVMDTCRQVMGDCFEGGFVPTAQARRSFPDLVLPGQYPLQRYMEKTAASPMAVCTPGPHDCLTWKLAEFLALGKATICLPLRREMPSPLVHGEHVHFVRDDLSDLEEAIVTLQEKREYRERLEAGARGYFEQYLAPAAVCRRMLEHLVSPSTGRPATECTQRENSDVAALGDQPGMT